MENEANLLPKLSDREVSILRLLSAGHTAKSIAVSTGLSVNAVNDRLREARRKTGIGSSRELARLVASQENWAEKIELSPQPGEDHEQQDVRPPVRTSDSRKGKIVFVLLAALILIVVAWGSRHGAPRPSADTGRDTALRILEAGDADDRRGLAVALEAESRDPAWASRSEALLKHAYAQVLKREGLTADLHVRCARTLCEVIGIYRAALSQENELSLRRALAPAAFPALANAGLANRGLTISSKDGETPRLTILAYWQAPPKL